MESIAYNHGADNVYSIDADYPLFFVQCLVQVYISVC